MKTRTKYILFILAGFAVGGILSVAYFIHLNAEDLKSEVWSKIDSSHNSAENFYYNEPNEEAIGVLKNSIETLTKIKQEITEKGYRSCASLVEPNSFYNYFLMLENAMLGNLYKKLSDSEKSKYYFGQAITISTNLSGYKGFMNTEEDCMKLLNMEYESRKQLDAIIHGVCGNYLDYLIDDNNKSDFNNHIRDINF